MEKLQELLKGKKKVAIAGHVNPDGDCIGSTLALYTYLKHRYKELEVDLYLEKIPEIYGFLLHAEEAQTSLCKDRKYDVFFALDSANPDRIGVASSLCRESVCTVNIDHHISNPLYGDVNIVFPGASSASEIVYELITQDGGDISRDLAQDLYLGIMQDTGVFKYSNTSARTMEIAGRLMETGIDFSTIVDRTFFEKTYEQTQILGMALTNSRMTKDGISIVSVITLKDQKRAGVIDSDMDGISSQLLNTKGVLASLFIRETKPGAYKVSLRSKTDLVDVNHTASIYNGGGHKRAAGCTFYGNPGEVVEVLTKDIYRQYVKGGL